MRPGDRRPDHTAIMRFTETKLAGAFIVELDRLEDERGFFARAFCSNEFEEHGLVSQFVQANNGFSFRSGVLRGLHYQLPPAAEAKFIRCIQGAIWDVIIDMRPESPTYLQHVGVELSAANRRALYVPEMFAHGYLTLADESETFYLASAPYTPGSERGVRYDDPALAIEWPIPVAEISDKDLSWDSVDMPRRDNTEQS